VKKQEIEEMEKRHAAGYARKRAYRVRANGKTSRPEDERIEQEQGINAD